MDPAKILQIITNSTWMVTKLVGSGPVEFTQQEYVTQVLENTPPRPLLQLSVRLHAQGEVVRFTIKGGNESGLFSLSPSTGRLSLLRPLDYESQKQHELLVEVRGRGGEGSSEARVVVQVVDVNDHAPYFPRALHETQITEEDDRHLPKTILTVSAVDGDAGKEGHLLYHLSGDGVMANRSLSYFAVDPKTGALRLLRPLDRDPPEGRSQWRLRVTASDGQTEAATVVHVNLKDINDNAPFFPRTTLNAAVPENSPKGASVAQVTATDHDDPQEGNNARLVYSLEKNVIDEASGRPIFAVDSELGLITTAICCLDREKAQRYAIQVVATDGGGLKGTGTVLVEVGDVNDAPPRFSREEWRLEVPESLTPDHPLAALTVLDQDLLNNFTFRVVPESGRGWQLFRVEVGGGGEAGEVWAEEALDYENPDHRRGFQFQVQVTDRGEGGWSDPSHVDSAWVSVQVVDDNDNTPVFTVDHAHLTLAEDASPGTLLTTFTAHDADQGGEGRVRYSVEPQSDPGGLFGVNGSGVVQLARGLDRETASNHNVLVVAVDHGVPPRTATATLTVNVTDVNDNPPFLAEPREVRVRENSQAQMVTRVRLGDPDDWRKGHGPPFTISLHPQAPRHVQEAVQVTFDERGDGGRGSGIVTTLGPLDREEVPLVLVPLVVGDAGSLTTTVTLTLHVTDVNDNPMTPAARHVQVNVLQPQASAVPLGRVYVDDPDDGDSASKTYAWRTYHHPSFFSLNTSTGDLSMQPGTQDGRYELTFLVNDTSQGQSGVSANVTVEVRSLGHRDVTEAIPLTLEASPYTVVKEENQGSPSLLRQLLREVRAWAKEVREEEEEEEEEGRRGTEGGRRRRVLVGERKRSVGGVKEVRRSVGVEASSSRRRRRSMGVEVVSVQQMAPSPTPATRVWVTSPGVGSLDLFLLHHRDQLGKAIGVRVLEVGVGVCVEAAQATTQKTPHQTQATRQPTPRETSGKEDANATPRPNSREDSASATNQPSSHEEDPHHHHHQAAEREAYSVVEAGRRAMVGPRVDVLDVCRCDRYTTPEGGGRYTCTPHTCLNGGRCLPTLTGYRCICPHGTEGHRCKILSRHFEGLGKLKDSLRSSSRRGPVIGGWAWLPPIPPCPEVHLSLEFLASSQDATILYSGPRGDSKSPAVNKGDLLALELREGRPSLVLDLGAGPVALTVNASYTVTDSKWHRLDLIWKDEQVELVLDLCVGGSIDGPLNTPPTTPTPHTTPTLDDDEDDPSSSPTSTLAGTHSCRDSSRLPRGARVLNTGQPLQMGGLAHMPPVHASHASHIAHIAHAWQAPLVARPFEGCIRNLRINGELIDLGMRVLARLSDPGCPAVDCMAASLNCGLHGRCQGWPGRLRCDCQLGWAGPGCATPTTPAAFNPNSYVKLALSFTPLAYTTTIHLRFRTWRRDGQLVVLSSEGGGDQLSLQLVGGQLCVGIHLHPQLHPHLHPHRQPSSSLCLTRSVLSDGRWHAVELARYGGATILLADEGEGELYNASLTLLGGGGGGPGASHHPLLLQVDAEEGVHVGGSPEYLALSVLTVHRDYFDGCLDDLRISGRSLPLPPTLNTTTWGEVRKFQGVEGGCVAPPACANVTCTPPLTCLDTWRSYHCGCEEGRVVSGNSGQTCEDVDECSWRPCLNAGSCYNTHHPGGYVCACPVGFSGQHCQIPDVGETSLKLSLGALLAIVVWCTFLLLLICAFLLHQHHRRSAVRRGEGDVKEGPHPLREPAATPCTPTPNLLEMQLLRPPRANGQPAWSRNPNIADVDVLQVDAASVTSSMEDQKRGNVSYTTGFAQGGGGGGGKQEGKGVEEKGRKHAGGGAGGAGGRNSPPTGDDLRNYAYEGEGSSPGSLSSCLESCSGSAKFLDGFREVAHMLESWDPTNHQSASAATKTNGTTKRDAALPITNILCDVHAAIGPDCGTDSQFQPMKDQNVHPESIDTPIPLPIPDPPRAFMSK